MTHISKTLTKTPRQAESLDAILPAEDARSLSLSEAVAAFHAHAADARRTYNGRERTLFEADPERIDRLIALLVEGNYRETAAQIVGITGRAVRQWMHKAEEEGDPRYQVIARVIRVAEAVAEARAVQAVRSAAKDPRFWAAEMTYLERRHPNRWGRRQEETSGPQVIVHIGGITASDVKIGVAVATRPAELPAITDGGE